MKRNKEISLKKSFLIVLLIVQVILISRIQNSSEMTVLGNDVKAYTSIDNIKIYSDDDFITLGLPGNGTEEDPYRIENYDVQSPYFFGIEVEYTTKHFIIQNCIVAAAVHSCIKIDHAASGTARIVDNIITGDIAGIWVFTSRNTIIANNTFQNNGVGIFADGAQNSVIANNTFSVFGLSVYMGDYDNLSDCLSYEVYNNTVNNKPIGWFKNEVDLVFNESSFEQIFFVNCSNLNITNQLSSSNVEGFLGIGLFYCQNVNITENRCGVNVVKGDRINIKNNYFTNTYLIIRSTTAVEIEGNRYKDGYFWSYFEGLNDVKVKNNKFGLNDFSAAIYLVHCYFSTIEGNSFIGSKEHGISLYHCGSLIIRNNEIYDNEIYGLYLRETEDCSIYQNIFARNKEYGVYVKENSIDNVFWFNIFTKNRLFGTAQASDNVATNYWHNTSTSIGNYWDDLGDSNTYSIGGSAGSSDLYPLNDTDDDGMAPDWEIKYDLDPWLDDSADDLDEDGLTNLEEYNNNCNPWKNDTDFDGLLDGEEVQNGSDPLDPNDPNKSSIAVLVSLLALSIVTLSIRRKKAKS